MTTREAILQAAAGLLSSGTGVGSMGAVATAAGCSRQSVHAHFRTRADLLTAVVEHMKAAAGVEPLIEDVYAAPSAVAALESYVEVMATLHPKIALAAVTLEQQRLMDGGIEAAFAARSGGRTSHARHVVVRLNAEGVLAAGWDVDTATTYLSASTGNGMCADLVLRHGWTSEDLRVHLTRALKSALLVRND